MPPGFACVVGSVHAVAGGDVIACRDLAHADVNHFWIRCRYGQCTHRSGADTVEHRSPRAPRVVALPDAPAGRAEVKSVGAVSLAGHGGGPAATEGPDEAPLERGRDVLGRCSQSATRQEQQQAERRTEACEVVHGCSLRELERTPESKGSALL